MTSQTTYFGGDERRPADSSTLDKMTATPAPRPSGKPDKAFIEALTTWAGGSLNNVPYTAPVMTGVGEANGDPVPSITAYVSGAWGGFWSRIAREMKYMRLEFADEIRGDEKIVYLPENWTVRVPSTGPDKIHQSLGQIFVGDPSIKVESPAREGVKDVERRRIDLRMTKMLTNMSQMEEQRSDTPPLKHIKTNCLPLGLSIRGVMLDPDWIAKFSDEPEREDGESDSEYKERLTDWRTERRNSSPIKSFSIHPSNICYDRENVPPQWALIREPIDPYIAAVKYPSWRGGSSVDLPGQSASYLCLARFWTPLWTAVYIDGEPALGEREGADSDGVAPNPYNFIPLWPAAGGHGYQDPKGRPEYELRGMLADHLDLLREDAYCENLEQIYLKRLTYGPKQGVIGGPDDPKEQRKVTEQLTSGPEEPVYLPAEAKLAPIPAEPIPDWLVARRRRLDERIDNALGYNIQYGASDPTEAAVRSKFRASQAERRYADAVLHMQQAEEGYYRGILRIIKHVLRRPIDVNVAIPDQAPVWETLDPDDIPDNPKVTVLLTGETEDEKARKQSADDARFTAPVPTLDIAEYLARRGEPDVEARIIALEADRIYITAYAPMLTMIAQKGAAAIIAAELAAKGVMLEANEIMKEYQALIAEGGGDSGPGRSAAQSMGEPQLSAGSSALQVNSAGAALPGTAYEDAESGVSDNPISTRPASPEAIGQGFSLEERRRRREGGLIQRLPTYGSAISG